MSMDAMRLLKRDEAVLLVRDALAPAFFFATDARPQLSDDTTITPSPTVHVSGAGASRGGRAVYHTHSPAGVNSWGED
ncbi:hypothetical protein LCGC14_2032930 [marine sediment metagenome]|uniref:Uncharacterized protein n=1 Tax=marine sediment metagenome TaxID=412755 RepID=A0A0F9FGP1_9ZZZZ